MAVSASETVDYVRICDPLGREVVYWSDNEFQEDAPCVLNAMARFLNRDRTDMMPSPLNPSLDKIEIADKPTKVQKSKSERTSLADLDFDVIDQLSLKRAKSLGGIMSIADIHGINSVTEDDYFELLDRERLGLADADDLQELDDAEDEIIIDWGDEYELEGLTVAELRGMQFGPDKTWILKDGRILTFFGRHPVG